MKYSAYLLLPNVLWSKIIGKLIFLACDMLIGYLIMELLKHLLRIRNYGKKEDIDSVSVTCTLFWLFNPIAMNVSTRGNAESVIGALVLLTLYLVVVRRSLLLGAVVYGIAIHVKIYPIVYSLPLFFYIDSWSQTPSRLRITLRTFFNVKRITFALLTVITLGVLTAVFYSLYGWTFLYETYLYHLVRKDNRHNFSVFFYDIYLNSSLAHGGGQHQLLQMAFRFLFDFGPQAALLITMSIVYYEDITFCVLLQTMAFVAFNKVCTVQYFCWYFSLLPLTLPWNKGMSNSTKALLPLAWAATQGIWLWYAYRLEFLGENTFYEIWLAGCAFFVVNVGIIIALIWHHKVDLPVSEVQPSLLAKERAKQKTE